MAKHRVSGGEGERTTQSLGAAQAISRGDICVRQLPQQGPAIGEAADGRARKQRIKVSNGEPWHVLARERASERQSIRRIPWVAHHPRGCIERTRIVGITHGAQQRIETRSRRTLGTELSKLTLRLLRMIAPRERAREAEPMVEVRRIPREQNTEFARGLVVAARLKEDGRQLGPHYRRRGSGRSAAAATRTLRVEE